MHNHRLLGAVLLTIVGSGAISCGGKTDSASLSGSAGSAGRGTTPPTWPGEHSFQRVLIASYPDRVLTPESYTLTATADPKVVQVTEHAMQCTMDLELVNNSLSGIDVPCLISGTDASVSATRIYSKITFDLENWTMVGSFEGHLIGQPLSYFIEDDIDVNVAVPGRVMAIGTLSQTAMYLSGTTPDCTNTDQVNGELYIVIEDASTIFFPGFRCRITAEVDSGGVYTAADVPCVPDATGPSFLDVGMTNRQIETFSYDPKSGRIAYSALSTGTAGTSPGKSGATLGDGSWCSAFVGSVAK